MSHGPEHQIEHAEHASHAAHDPFDRQVTVSIAIVAAFLAGVTLLSHRAHNDTLVHQGDALRHRTHAAVKANEATDAWAEYQANKNHAVMYQLQADALEAQASLKPEAAKTLADWREAQDKHRKRLPGMQEKAKKLEKEKESAQAAAEESLRESHEVHAKTVRFDLGELALQLGVVLCSLAILSKRRVFWYIGLAASVVGVLIALSGLLGLFMGDHGAAGHH